MAVAKARALAWVRLRLWVTKVAINNLQLRHNNVCHKQPQLRAATRHKLQLLRAVTLLKLQLLQHRLRVVTSNVQLRVASSLRAILTSHKAVLIRQHHNNVAQWNHQSTLTTIFRSKRCLLDRSSIEKSLCKIQRLFLSEEI
jgi:hypothetical protein